MPRFVGLQELCQQPVGAIFSTSDQSGNVAGLYRRGEARKCDETDVEYYKGEYCDFYYHDLIPSSDGHDTVTADFPDIDDGGRWGNYDPNEVFVLWDESDRRKMAAFILGSAVVEGEQPPPA